MDAADLLIIEDNPNDLELTLRALKKSKVTSAILTLKDGAEALDYLFCRGRFAGRNTPLPKVIFLDLKLPKISGLEVLKIIKADEQLKIIPVVVLSSSRETPDVVECYRHGVNAYVVKPVDFAEFMKAVKLLGIFWAAINEPPIVLKNETLSGKEEVKT